MSPLVIFLTELCLGLGISLLVIALIRPLLRSVLFEVCGDSGRAAVGEA